MSPSDPIRLTGSAIDEEPPAAGRTGVATQECKWCNVEGPPEWSPYANTWIHRRNTVDKPCSNPPKDTAAHAAGLRLLNIGRGCHDYQGGYSEPRESEIYHHGIQTVVQALTAAMVDRDALQVRVLESIGQRGVAFPAGKCPECDQPMLPEGKVKRPNEYDHAQGCPLDASATQECECQQGKALGDIAIATPRWSEGGSFAGGETWHGFSQRLIRHAQAALAAPCSCTQLRQERDDALANAERRRRYITECRQLMGTQDSAQVGIERLIRERDSLRAKVADLSDWIKVANQFAWAHERTCPRHDADEPCNCGLDQFLCRPRPVVESFRAELNGAKHIADLAKQHWEEWKPEEIRLRAELAAALSLLDQAREALSALPLKHFDRDGEDIDAADFVDHAKEFVDAMILARVVLAKIDAARKPPGGDVK